MFVLSGKKFFQSHFSLPTNQSLFSSCERSNKPIRIVECGEKENGECLFHTLDFLFLFLAHELIFFVINTWRLTFDFFFFSFFQITTSKQQQQHRPLHFFFLQQHLFVVFSNVSFFLNFIFFIFYFLFFTFYFIFYFVQTNKIETKSFKNEGDLEKRS